MISRIKPDAKGRVPLKKFSPWVDASQVYYYALKTRKDDSLVLKFYGKNKKLLKLR